MDTEPPGDYYLLFDFILLNISPIGLFISILILLLLLLGSALISGSEIAFFSLDANDNLELEDDHNTISNLIIKLLKEPAKLLATILISNNFINIAIVILSTYVLEQVLPNSSYLGIATWVQSNLYLENYPAESIALGFNLLITVVAVTFLLVLFGEVAPKIYAKFNNMKFAKFMARPLNFLNSLFGPISNILVKWTDVLERRLGEKNSNGSSIKEDLDHAIELTVNHQASEESEADILRGIINFSDLTVKQIMTPRMDVVGFDVSGTFEELINMIRESGFSRIPIYSEDFDNLSGILYVKDLIGILGEKPDYDWTPLIREDLLYAPESKKVNELLKDFQSRRLHLAIVVDEYGGSSGIATLEDVMEEVVGDIRDEFDEEEELEYVKIDDHNYIFEGKVNLHDVARITGIDLASLERSRGESDTLAGLMLEILGYIPKVDREIAVGNMRLKVVSVDKKRIEKISLIIQS